MKKLKAKGPRFKPHTKSDWADNEIPQGLRTRKYRFFEILPGFMAYFMILLLVILSIVWPVGGSIYLLIVITITLVKAVGVAFRTVQGYNTVKRAECVNWHKRVADLETPHDSYERHYRAEVKRLKLLDIAHMMRNKKEEERLERYAFDIDMHIANRRKMAAAENGELVNPNNVYHAVLVMAYNEGEETLGPSIEAIKKSTFSTDRIIVVLDEFQEILDLDPRLDKKLRAIMQNQKNINYILLGSQESMMTDIFEKKKSPFYHFGELMRLGKLPRENFHKYLSERLKECFPNNSNEIADHILDYTFCHPYYSQQLVAF